MPVPSPVNWHARFVRCLRSVRVVACDFKGNVNGEWMGAEARFCDAQQAKRAGRLLDRRYPMKLFFNVLAFLFRRKRALIAIRPAAGA